MLIETRNLEKRLQTKRLALTRDSGGNQIEIKLKEEISNSQVLKQQ